MSEKRGKNFKKRPKDRKSAKDISPSEPFVLTYDSRHYSSWRECMALKAKLLYGRLGNLCDTDKLEDEPAIDPTKYDIDNDDATIAAIQKAMLHADVSERQKEVARVKNDKPKLYSLLLQYLSAESLAQVMKHPGFKVETDVNDPLKLWLAIKVTHRAGADAVNAIEQKTETRNALNDCKQGLEEQLHLFYKRWKNAYDAYKDAGNTELAEEDRASGFLSALNTSLYYAMKAELHNDAIRGIAMPKTVADMYHHAARYVIPRKETKSTYGAAFNTVGEGKSRPRGSSKRGGRGSNKLSSTEERLRALEEKFSKDRTAQVGKEEPTLCFLLSLFFHTGIIYVIFKHSYSIYIMADDRPRANPAMYCLRL